VCECERDRWVLYFKNKNVPFQKEKSDKVRPFCERVLSLLSQLELRVCVCVCLSDEDTHLSTPVLSFIQREDGRSKKKKKGKSVQAEFFCVHCYKKKKSNFLFSSQTITLATFRLLILL